MKKSLLFLAAGLAIASHAAIKPNVIIIYGDDVGTTVPTSTKEVDRGHDASGIDRGGKYQIYEGGTRVPLIIRWPGRIKPGVSEALVNQIDFISSFATLLDLEISSDEAKDSRDTLDAFLGEDPNGLPFMIEEAEKKARALRVGDWKYLGEGAAKNKPKGTELYNLKTDPSEKKNVIKDHPEKAEAMAKQLMELMKAPGVR